MMNYRNPHRVSSAPLTFYEPINPDLTVKNNLAVTPSQMADLTERGVAVSSSNLQFDEGSPNPSSVVPIDARRGVDVNDVWQAQQSSRKKLRTAAASIVEAPK